MILLQEFIIKIDSYHRRLILLALLAFFCGYSYTYFCSAATPESENTPTIIRVGFYENSPKLFTKPDGQPGGIFPEVLKYIAAQEGWQLEWVRGSWRECLERLEKGQIDIMPDVAFSLERSEKYDFTNEPVLLNWATLYTSTEQNITSIIDLDNLRIAVMRGSIHTEGREGIKKQVENFRLNCKFLEFESYSEVFQAVHNGLADVGVVNRLFGLISSHAYDILPTTVVFNPRHIKFAFPLGSHHNPGLKNSIDRHLEIANSQPDSPIKQIITSFLKGTPLDWTFQLTGGNPIYLTEEELLWIKNHPTIRLGIDPEFAPFEFRNDDNLYSGFAADYVEILNRRLGLNMKVIPNLDWNEVIDLSKKKKLDVLPAVGFTSDRRSFLRFSTPYIGFHRVIISHIDTPFISGINDLKEKRIGVQANTSHSGWLKENDSFSPIEYDSLAQTLQAVSNGDADVMIGNLAACTYMIRQLNITNLRVSAPVSSRRLLIHFGVRKDWSTFVSILNKGLASISSEEAEMIRNRWTAAGYNIGIPAEIMWKRIGLVLIGAFLLICSFWAWSFKLKNEIDGRKIAERKLQKAQTKLEERVKNRTQELATTNQTLKQEMREKIKLEKQLFRSQKMETIGLMAGGVAHDLNNILTGIISYPDLLLMKLPKDSELRPLIEEIRLSGKQAGEVAADLLTIARESIGMRIVANLNSLISEYLHSPEHKNTVELHKEIIFEPRLASKLLNISCSPVHIKKCLMNLINNGADAIKGQGTIVISTDNLNKNEVHHYNHSLEKKDYVVITIKDSGTGIAPTHIKRIFDPFYSKKIMGNRSGSGLGLTVVWNTVHDHDGIIDVTSSSDGTIFTLFFPATREEIPDKKSTITIEKLKGNNEKILVVDDEGSQRFIICELLELLGYRAFAVASGEESVAYLSNNTVDLILMDMSMGEGISGQQAYEQIIQIHPGQKTIIISGLTTSDNVKKTIELGAQLALSKPFTIETLGMAIKNVLSDAS